VLTANAAALDQDYEAFRTEMRAVLQDLLGFAD